MNILIKIFVFFAATFSQSIAQNVVNGTIISTDKIIITWSTSSETNNDYFILLKAGEDYLFKPIERVCGSGNSSTTRNYRAVDQFPLRGVNYYKIRQVDYDRRFTESPVISKNYYGVYDLKYFDVIRMILLFPDGTTDL